MYLLAYLKLINLKKPILAIFVLIKIISVTSSFAQTGIDTLEMAKNLRNENKIKFANRLLRQYTKSHKEDLNGLWLYAQTSYWMNHNKKAERIYEKNIKLHPDNYNLKLDYAKMLVEIGEIEKAKPLIEIYLKYNPKSTEASVLFYKVLFWKGDNQSGIDILEMAKKLKNDGKIKSTYNLLKQYTLNNFNDIDGLWLFAQTAYWMKHFKESESIYENTIQLYPDNYYLKLDYAKMLVSIGNFNKAQPLLNAYLNYDSTNVEALTLLAKISYWQGNYNEAENKAVKVLARYPEYNSALTLQNEILLAKSPWIELGSIYTSDDQPLQNISPAIGGGIYLNSLFSPYINVQTPIFIDNSNTTNSLLFKLGNKSLFSKAGIELNINAGVFKYPNNNTITWTGNIDIDKTFIRHLILSAKAEHKPYIYTLSSLDSPLSENHYNLTLNWNNPDSWNGKISYDIHQFDNNYTSSLSGWVVTPPLKVSIVDFRVGYGYNYSTSKENRFVSKKTIAEILDTNNYYNDITYFSHIQIEGVYNPYFTPYKQKVHTALVSIAIHPLKTLDLGIKASYGFKAEVQTPYLYLNNDASSNIIIEKNYFTKNYSPLEINAYATFKINNKTILKAEYTYSKTNFYKSNYVGLGLKMSLFNEKK